MLGYGNDEYSSGKSVDIYFFGKSIFLQDAENDEIIDKIQNDYEITLDMEDKTEIVDSIIFEELSKKEDLDFSISTDNAEWRFNSKDITETNINFNPKITISGEKFDEIESQEIKQGVFIKFEHNGILPGRADIALDIGKLRKNYSEGQKLYLYYYNSNENKYEFISETRREPTGWINISLDHCSDYVLVEDKIEQSTKVTGDINGDGKVSLLDYGLVLAHVKRTKLLEGEQLERADVNGDNKVTLIDYGRILAHVKRTKLLF